MESQLKQTWIEALQSGKYPKGKFLLKGTVVLGNFKSESFCCLGVLCEIKQYPKEQLEKISSGQIKTIYIFENGKFSSTNIVDNIGISVFHMDKLITINDRTENFDEVIEYIKTNL